MLVFARRLVAPIVATVLMFVVALPALADPSVGIAPATGAQTDTFTVSGNGIQPALSLDINFKSPGGAVFSTANLNQTVTVDGDGNFSFDFVPAMEFQGESLGTWVTQVCVSGTNTCVAGTCDIGT